MAQVKTGTSKGIWLTLLAVATTVLFVLYWQWHARHSVEGPSPSAVLLTNGNAGADWPSYGGTYDEWHYSPLGEVNAGTVDRLGLVAALDLPETHNAGTVPLAVDGVIYFTVDQSIVRAFDVKTKKLLWTFNPQVMKRGEGLSLRQGWGPRGIAWWDGKIYVGTTDGRLIAIDAKTGKQRWSTQTFDFAGGGYISGPPRIFDGLVLIGFGGADYGNIRGYVTAYDAQTGRKVWRFYTVPGNPADGFENEAMRMAAKTWKGEWWKYGGGGTVWNAMTYDPELDLVYIGVGNGSPWNQAVRSPGGGDNLFLASIVALDAKTGEYRWHYQVNPGESWDYTATMDMQIATVTIDGKPRKVLFQAPKNGFFYVIDRSNGKLISAEKIAKVTWAERIDLTTGRPVEAPGIRYYKNDKTVLIYPGNVGAHSWAPMSFNPQTGLVYIPTNEIAGAFNSKGVTRQSYKYVPGKGNLGINLRDGDVPTNAGSSTLQAWDPVRQRQVWSVPTPGILNGGTMTTAGGLVFQGLNDGTLRAFDARSGKELWSFDAHMGIAGAPITFSTDGRQYIAVVAGWGGTNATMMGKIAAQFGWQYRRSINRLLVFALDGKAQLEESPAPEAAVPVDDPEMKLDPGRVEAGMEAYVGYCSGCHGAGVVAGGQVPDLRASAFPLDAEMMRQVVIGGILQPNGMPAFKELSPDTVENIRQYIRSRARAALSGESEPEGVAVLPR
ncbi:PQQ-dependent dehydrogenase, methanol/ethanol family [Novosphingobium pentaromativorans]|uniref:Alcohol dehydrogenase n=1 Tax=Novosphingobium pentaromativorans US6-1 TaxID=1088721 RepID=G6EGH4_9SPHN|nr:PQQ-dependent dehydrogenase, methanol/ethanol family [Novosphingobium pentaromativorans]AIT82110.1 alcohol dehydrogenase [Novosphingobium pentaromativorans US6-1]EHJ59625.1 alcohol dehydrogenase [Novosphingobium pentaromativorans US6-1]